jgi:LuxR family maltose regulon positive regulatory protein
MNRPEDSAISANMVSTVEPTWASVIAWTKVTVPQQGVAHLSRERLVDTLHNMIDRKLILVRAPAGYGKTSLLVDFAHESEIQACWFTVEEQDADLYVFLTYLTASIAHRFPAFGERSARLLQSMGDGVHKRLRVFVATLVNEILQTIPEYFFLILDDYHVLDDASAAHEFVRQFIDFMPEQCHLLIGSRTVPPLPLIRLVARQQMAAIGVDDLRFQDLEIQQLAADKLGMSLSLDQAQFLAQQTDGWITAILLSANTGWDALLTGASFSSGLTETGIYDYLMNEVLDCQPERVRRFLLHTAVLNEMTLSLCNELMGSDSQDILRMLERNNLFISRVEAADIETAFRYHPLFRDFLLSRLRVHKALYRQLSAQAADLMANRQDWYNAVHHNLNAGRYDQVQQIILSHYDDLNMAGRRETVAHWIDLLPPEYVSPELQVKRALWATNMGQIDTALRLFANAIVLYESQQDNLNLAHALIERSYALSKSGSYSEAIQDCRQALVLLEGKTGTNYLRGRAYRYLGRIHDENGDPNAALHFLSLSYQCMEQCDAPPIDMARLAQDIGVAYGLRGQFREAVQQYEAALKTWKRLGNEGEIAFTLNSIGAAQHQLGEYQAALNTLHHALEKSRSAGFVRAEAYTLTSLGDLYCDLGQSEQALGLYDQAHPKAETIEEGFLVSYITNAKALALCLVGQAQNARLEIERALAQKALSKHSEARCRLALAAALLSQQMPERAVHELNAALVLSSDSHDIAFRGHLQLAQAAMLEGRARDSSEHLHTAFQLAQEAGLTQPLSVESLNHVQVLEYVAEKEGPSQELTRWLDAAHELAQVRDQLVENQHMSSSAPQIPELEIYALGSSRVIQNGSAVAWRTNQAKELFFYLLTHPNGQTKQQIGASLWPDHSQAKLFSIFRSTLFRLRKALCADVILYQDDQYSLNPAVSYTYDVQAFENEMSKGERSDNPVQKAYHYRQAVNLYQGNFLLDLYSDWIMLFREALQARYLKALMFLAQFHLERKRYPQAIEFARHIVTNDEYHEAGYYVLTRAYIRSGQRPQAKRIYERCCKMLSEFGLEPQQSWEQLCH